jgi:sarcosine oxidase subunit alpha
MTARPYRLPADALGGRAGRLIDRRDQLRFSFDGKQMSGFAGDTLASALLANGERLIGRSFKYHRPRGVMALGAEEPNGLVTLGSGDQIEPNVRATTLALFEGLTATSQNRWPSLSFDIGAVNGSLSRFLPSGFYYKTFMGPTRSAWMWFEPFIRRAAGLGPAPRSADPAGFEHLRMTCDVLVVGAGIAGLTAVRAAAESGARVVLCDENPRLGGLADLMDQTIEGQPALEWARGTVAELARADNVRLLTRTTASGHYDHNYLHLVERVTGDGDENANMSAAANGALSQRIWKVRAKETILASGALERPLTFADNDRPGVMLASAVRGYVLRYGVAPGQRGVVFANNDDAYLTALTLHEAGVSVARIVDVRPNPQGDLVDRAKSAGIPLLFGSGLFEVETEARGTSLTGVTAGALRVSGRVGQREKIACDFVAMSGGWNPVIHLFCHSGGKPRFDDTLQAFVPGETRERLTVVGSAAGTFDLADILPQADAAGAAAAKAALGAPAATRSGKAPGAEPSRSGPLEPIWFVPAHGAKNVGNKHFIDFQNDVTAADLELATQEGYRSVEHVKRYTTTGMATDQGKTSNVNALGILSDALDRPIPEIGTTTFRPPYTPVSFGVLAGMQAKELFQPVRRTPISTWHDANGADYEPVGLWRRPYCYPRQGEDRAAAVNREILAVREGAGIIDVSTLGKIEVQGPDAGAFLDRIYTNVMSSLKVGRCRYGLMMDEQGFLIDDGVVVRLEEDRFLLHTTSGNSDRIAAWLELWLQTEWTDMKVFVTPVTEQWAQVGVAGPQARAIVEKLPGSIDWSREAFPMLAMREGKILGLPARAYRISFSGELSYEIAVPADAGLALWEALLEAGSGDGLTPYGTEALHVLRAEKGFIAIGDETDGMTTPLDLGLGWAVSKKKADYIGKHSLARPHMAAQELRKQFVGILTEDPEKVLPIGSYASETRENRPPVKTIGHVSSSYWSPTLGRSIALALIANGRARHGETVHFPLEHEAVAGKIVDPVFFDREGKRQDG